MKIIAAELDGGALVPLVVQPEGKRPMSYTAWHNGARPAAGEWFE